MWCAGIPSESGVVDDGCRWISLKNRLGKQSDDVVALDEVSVLVKEEAAVVISIPCDAEVVGACLHVGDGAGSGFFKNRVWNAIREVAVWGEEAVGGL